MNATLEKYLDTVDKCLKPLPTSERVDIVKEIKSSILEMESDNLTTEQILDRLGKPKDLAKAYLGDLLSKGSGFSWNRFLTVCAFYSIVGFSGMFVIPCLAIMAHLTNVLSTGISYYTVPNLSIVYLIKTALSFERVCRMLLFLLSLWSVVLRIACGLTAFIF